MSVQIFLQARITGGENFLLAAANDSEASREKHDQLFLARCHYLALASEVLPRALLRHLGLAEMLLGASGGGHFLLVLPQESQAAAEEVLRSAAEQMRQASGETLRLQWSVTENLGDWSDVRKRLNEGFARYNHVEKERASEIFEPFEPQAAAVDDEFFAPLAAGLRDAKSVGWSASEPARFVLEGGEIAIPLAPEPNGIVLPRYAAPNNNDEGTASTAELAGRANGAKRWGVLRGDVDQFGVRLRRAGSIEEHIQISILYQRFFAGELELLCSMPGFWRRVTLLYSGRDNFAAVGAWDALIDLAREMHRMFHTLAESSMKEFPGPEGKTITMALSLAPDADATIAETFADASEKMELAKTVGKDGFHLFGRTLEWRQWNEANELKDEMTKLITEHGCSPQFLSEVGGFYRETTPMVVSKRGRSERLDRPWRFHRRLSILLGEGRGRDFQKVRDSVMAELIGKNAAQARLRPSGRVALEWANLASQGRKG